jgi:hypothetical protein
VIGNAEAAADIDVMNGVAIGAERLDQLGHEAEGVAERFEVGDLAADMHVDADGFDIGQFGDALIDFARALIGNAELVLALTSRDLGVRARIDVRIDADGDAGCEAHVASDHRETFEFGFALDVETLDTGGEALAHFGDGFCDAREDDLFGRNAGGEGALQFAARDDVGAAAFAGHQGQHGLVRIGLHGVGHQRRDALKGFAHDADMAAQGCRGIDIKRCADLFSQLVEIDVLGIKRAVAVLEMVDHFCAFGAALAESVLNSALP